MKDDEIIQVVRAHADGKPIECRLIDGDQEWHGVGVPQWNFHEFDYRVKPKPREWWIFPMGRSNGKELYELGTAARALGMDGVIHVREVLPDQA